MATVYTEFLNANEARAYPLSDRATRADRNGTLLPNDLLVDANIWLPRSLGQFVMVSSVCCSPALVSLTFLAFENSPFCATETLVFKPVAVLTIRKPATRFQNYDLTPLVPGVGGWVTLGNGILQDQLTLVFNQAVQSILLDRCVRAYPDLPVRTLGKSTISPPLTGVIRLQGSPGLVRTFGAVYTVDGKPCTIAMIGLDPGTDIVATQTRYAGNCGHRPSAKNCNFTPITSINGIKPDCAGNIDLDFTQDLILLGTGDGMVIDSQIGLAQACAKAPAITDTALLCGGGGSLYPPIPGSLHWIYPGESHRDHTGDSETHSLEGGSYCENFDDDLTQELSVDRGEFVIAHVQRSNTGSDDIVDSLRLISGAGLVAAEQIALNRMRAMNAYIGYTVTAVINPRSQSMEGHVIFGHANPYNFFMAGVTLTHPSYPNGAFFLAQRVQNPALGGGTLGPGNPGSMYLFLAGSVVAWPASLQSTDYKFVVNVLRVGSNITVDWTVTWLLNGQPQSSHQTTVITPLDGWKSVNNLGLTGVGTYDSVTEFDDFGINCPPSTYLCPTFPTDPVAIGLHTILPHCPLRGFHRIVSGVDAENVVTPVYANSDNLSIFLQSLFSFHTSAGQFKSLRIRTSMSFTSSHTEGHVAFAFEDEGSFWLIGVTRSHVHIGSTGYSRGLLFLAKRTPGVPCNCPELALLDYTLVSVVEPDNGDDLNDYDSNVYNLEIWVTGFNGQVDAAVTARVSWTKTSLDTGNAVLRPTVVAGLGAAQGALGYGAIKSQTEFTPLCLLDDGCAIAGTASSHPHDCTFVPVHSSHIPHSSLHPGSSLSGSLVDDFEDLSAPELTVVAGAPVITNGLITVDNLRVDGRSIIQNRNYYMPGPGAEGLIVDLQRRMKAKDRFRVRLQCAISLIQGDAFIVFGYVNPTNFYVAGVVVSHPSYPMGAIFIAKRTPTGGGGALGLGSPGSGYTFIHTTAMGTPYAANSYFTMDLQLWHTSEGSAHNKKANARLTVDWHEADDGAIYRLEDEVTWHTNTLDWTTLHDTGYVGFGSVAQLCSFDDFLINVYASPPAQVTDNLNMSMGSLTGAGWTLTAGGLQSATSGIQLAVDTSRLIRLSTTLPGGCDIAALDVNGLYSRPAIIFGYRSSIDHWIACIDWVDRRFIIAKTCEPGWGDFQANYRIWSTYNFPWHDGLNMTPQVFNMFLNLDFVEGSNTEFIRARVILQYFDTGANLPFMYKMDCNVPRMDAEGYTGIASLGGSYAFSVSFPLLQRYPWSVNTPTTAWNNVPPAVTDGITPQVTLVMDSDFVNNMPCTPDSGTPPLDTLPPFTGVMLDATDHINYQSYPLGELNVANLFRINTTVSLYSTRLAGQNVWKLTLTDGSDIGGGTNPFYWVGYKIGGDTPAGIYVNNYGDLSYPGVYVPCIPTPTCSLYMKVTVP